MEKLSLKEIGEALNTECECDGYIDYVCTDNRLARQGCLFVAIVGENTDGHKYALSAVENGAAAIVANHIVDGVDVPQIIVNDTKKALGDLTKYYLQKLGVKVLAITGSVGKTTTRNMAYAAISAAFPAIKTMKNYNNDIGLPLSVLTQLEKKHEIAVLEMGMNHFGEIDYLSKIANPDAAIITNIGMSHIENLGSQQGILRAKLEVCDGMKDDAVLILNGDDELLAGAETADINKVFYATENKSAQYRGENIELFEDGVKFEICYQNKRLPIKLCIPGKHNVYNALAAFAAAKFFGADDDKIISGLESFVPSDMRMELLCGNDFTIINDCYNASPDSMKAAVNVLAARGESKKIAVLGDMLEMGEFASKAHEEVGAFCKQNNIDLVLCTGEHGKQIACGAAECGKWFENKDEIIEFLTENDISNSCILIKASRGMHFEEITKVLVG